MCKLETTNLLIIFLLKFLILQGVNITSPYAPDQPSVFKRLPGMPTNLYCTLHEAYISNIKLVFLIKIELQECSKT